MFSQLQAGLAIRICQWFFLGMDELLRIARIAQSVTPVTVIHSTASAQSRVAALHLLGMTREHPLGNTPLAQHPLGKTPPKPHGGLAAVARAQQIVDVVMNNIIFPQPC